MPLKSCPAQSSFWGLLSLLLWAVCYSFLSFPSNTKIHPHSGIFRRFYSLFLGWKIHQVHMDICGVSRSDYTARSRSSCLFIFLAGLALTVFFLHFPLYLWDCLANIHSFPSQIGLHGKKFLPVLPMLDLVTLLPLCNGMLRYMTRLKICICF